MVQRQDPFKALADSTRRGILELLLTRATCSAGEIAGAFPYLSRPAVSRHLRVLRQAGLVRAHGMGREQRYRLEVEPLARLQREWFVQFTHISQAALSALKERVESQPGRARRTGKDPKQRRGATVRGGTT